MGVSDEIEVTTITIEEATIVWPFQSSLKTLVGAMTAKKPARVCCTFRVFVLLIFSFPSSLWLRQSSIVALPRKAILDMRRFRLKHRQFYGQYRGSERKPRPH